MSIMHPFAIIARACEALNAFAVTLRQAAVFTVVTTGTDLRQYNTGWKFEKYVEGQLNPKEGQVAVWWLEISEDNGKWCVVGNTSISYGDYDVDVATVTATDDELEIGVLVVVKALIDSYKTGNVFREKMEELVRITK